MTKVNRRNTNLAKNGGHSSFFGGIVRVASTTSARSLYISAGQRAERAATAALLLVQVAVGRGERLVVFVEFVRKTSEKIEDV